MLNAEAYLEIADAYAAGYLASFEASNLKRDCWLPRTYVFKVSISIKCILSM
jgi:hypothetical protein